MGTLPPATLPKAQAPLNNGAADANACEAKVSRRHVRRAGPDPTPVDGAFTVMPTEPATEGSGLRGTPPTRRLDAAPAADHAAA